MYWREIWSPRHCGNASDLKKVVILGNQTILNKICEHLKCTNCFDLFWKFGDLGNGELRALFGRPEEVQGCLEEKETPASGPVVHAGWGHCPHCEKLQTVAGGILWWQGHQPQDRLPVVATFPRPEPLWLFSLGLFEGSGLQWITSNCIGTEELNHPSCGSIEKQCWAPETCDWGIPEED